MAARGVRCRIVSSSGKFIGYRLSKEIENKDKEDPHRRYIFNIVPKVRDTGIHLKVDALQRANGG